jgi:hypothetical protein
MFRLVVSDLVWTVNEVDATLWVLQKAVAFAVMTLPIGIARPVTVQVPDETKTGDPAATPLEYT